MGRQVKFQPPPGAERYLWSGEHANESRRDKGVFKMEFKTRRHGHRDRRGRRGAAVSLDGEMDWRTAALGGQSFAVDLLG